MLNTYETTTAGSVDTTSIAVDVVGGRAAHTATTLLDGSVFVVGGCISNGCTTATADTFLVSPDGKRAVPGLPLESPRDSHTANLLTDGRVVFAGGYPGEGAGVLSSIEVVDPNGAAATLLEMAQARGGHASATTSLNAVLVVGGWIRSQTYTASAELIDVDVNTITRLSDLPWAADALDAVTLSDGRILVTGGQVEPDVPTAQAAVLDPVTRRWRMVGPMGTARLKHFSVRLDDGRVLVMGGDTGNQSITATTELFDPETLSFAPGPTMSEARYKFPNGAIVLDDGRVLVAGGGRAAEVLDIATGTTVVIGEHPRVGSFATVNKLGNGNVIVIGGYDDHINLRRDAFVIPAAKFSR